MYSLSPTNTAWLCKEIADHYHYTGDEDYLKNKAYPFFKKYGEREVYFQTCYDQYNVGQGYAARYFYASYEGGTNIPEV